MKFTKEEKVLIKAYVNYNKSKIELGNTDAQWLENDLSKMLNRRNSDFRFDLEDFIKTLI